MVDTFGCTNYRSRFKKFSRYTGIFVIDIILVFSSINSNLATKKVRIGNNFTFWQNWAGEILVEKIVYRAEQRVYCIVLWSSRRYLRWSNLAL